MKLTKIITALFAQMMIQNVSHAVMMPVEGRVRPTAVGEMQVLEAQGTFGHVKSAYLEILKRSQDAQGRSFRMILNDQASDFMPMFATMTSECRPVQALRTLAPDQNEVVQLNFVNNASGQCLESGKAWRAELKAINQQGQVVGLLVLEGNPQPIWTIQVEQVL
jgi:hypothetical protein